MTITLRPYQKEGLDNIWNYFTNGEKGNPVLAWPTGTGKSIVPAIFIKSIMDIWPTQRFILLTHVKELIEQNAEVLRLVWPNAPLGIYSAGLKEKNPLMPIVFAGIQSAIKNPSLFGHRDIAFIDEAHLISTDEASMYLTFLATLRLINPKLRIIGMTATPFRMGQGLITDNGLFTHIVHDLTEMDNFNRLIAEGYLSPLVPLRTKTKLNVDSVGIQKGEFIQSQLQHAVDVAEVTYQGLQEFVEGSKDRKSWLLFASGIEHAEHISHMLGTFGIDCVAVHSKQSMEFNNKAIRAFRQNELRAIVNYGKLTTGFNHPAIDAIGMFRPTMSVPLHIQMLGRGTRPAEGKKNCLVMDFGRNVWRLGPINDPMIPRKKGDGGGEIPIKICEACGVYNHIKAKFCTNCNQEFKFEIKITKTSGTQEIIKTDIPIIEMFDVEKVVYTRYQKGQKPPSIKIAYHSGLRVFNEFVFPEYGGYTKHMFHNWWKQRHKTPAPITTDDALKLISELRTPKQIRVHCNLEHPKVIGVVF